jgi:hypothetical protein
MIIDRPKKTIILSMPRSGTNFVSSILRKSYNVSTEPLRKSKYNDNFDVKKYFYELVQLPNFCYKYFLEFEEILPRVELIDIIKKHNITTIALIRKNILYNFVSWHVSVKLQVFDIYEHDTQELQNKKYKAIEEVDIEVSEDDIVQHYNYYKEFIEFYRYFQHRHQIDYKLFYENLDFSVFSPSKRMLNQQKIFSIIKSQDLENKFLKVSKNFTDIANGLYIKDDIYQTI